MKLELEILTRWSCDIDGQYNAVTEDLPNGIEIYSKLY